jgi:hypothetical protein
MKVHNSPSNGTADETTQKCKMALPQQKSVYELWFWELKSVTKIQRCYSLKHEGQSVKCRLEEIKETGSVLHKKGIVRPSVDSDRVCEAMWHSTGKFIHYANRELQIC